MTTYSLGSDDAELARLTAQAEYLREPTQVLLASAGLEPGMRVLDLGTGLGHLADAAAELVGADGAVVGVDVDARMLEMAGARAHPPNVRFVHADVTHWHDEGPYDAVVGRLILFHLADPVGVLHGHLAAVRPGGRAVLLDYDFGGIRTQPANPLVDRMAELMMAAFRSAGADPLIGSRLKPILVAAGLEAVDGMGIAQYLDPDDPVGPTQIAGVIRSLAPMMIERGLATADELDPDTLPVRLAESVRSTGSLVVLPLLVGAWGRRPG